MKVKYWYLGIAKFLNMALYISLSFAFPGAERFFFSKPLLVSTGSWLELWLPCDSHHTLVVCTQDTVFSMVNTKVRKLKLSRQKITNNHYCFYCFTFGKNFSCSSNE